MNAPWLFTLATRPAVRLATVTGQISAGAARSIGAVLTNHFRSSVVVERTGSPVRRLVGWPIQNPSGLVWAVDRAIGGGRTETVAELYASKIKRPLAERVGRLIGRGLRSVVLLGLEPRRANPARSRAARLRRRTRRLPSRKIRRAAAGAMRRVAAAGARPGTAARAIHYMQAHEQRRRHRANPTDLLGRWKIGRKTWAVYRRDGALYLFHQNAGVVLRPSESRPDALIALPVTDSKADAAAARQLSQYFVRGATRSHPFQVSLSYQDRKGKLWTFGPRGQFRAAPNRRGRRKARKARKARNPRAAPTLERARRTFRKWHEFDAHKLVKVRGPARTIPRTLVKLGELTELVYRSDKWEGRQRLYKHRTERPHPILATDPDGKHVHLVGGHMRVTADGLVG